jgi:hypothetical protein
MGDIEKIAALIVTAGIITTLVLPQRQTVQVLGAIENLFSGSLATAIQGTKH